MVCFGFCEVDYGRCKFKYYNAGRFACIYIPAP